MNRVVIKSAYEKYAAHEISVKKAVRTALLFLKKDNVSVEVNLVSDKEIGELNRRFRGKNRVTNVLSFSEPAGFPNPGSRLRHLGEIYLAPDYIQNAGESISALAIHGTLHLLGFSHSRRSDRIRMERLEEKILKQSG